MGCLLWPFVGLKWCFTHGWKGIIVLLVVIVVGIIGFTVTKNAVAPEKKVTAIEQAAIPARTQAPYLVQTSSRYYYAQYAIKDKKTEAVTMTDYWAWDGNEWVENPETRILEKKRYGEITVTKRRK